ncbi:histone-lysine N-methyltransferase PRDM9-like [Homalodisca vitripennis]|uniref:histone-lysine N-methyltransferase PRDM9-like n=1 Tax=Homalodisca vitripennis TaxID=197043 RepID=UPI001EEA8E54|nr:histone-lysine N-methyltransferase PRDM9-like [Homalodisca vitripennis]
MYIEKAVALVQTDVETLHDNRFCDICDREYEGDCPVHGPYIIFHDNYVPVTGEEGRAEKTSPALVHVAKSKIPGGGSGVWTTVGLPGHARLGPYEGKKSDQPDPLGYSWTIMKNRKVDHYIAADSTVTSNWMRFVNCARHESEQNLMAFQYKGHLYYRTVKPVPPKAELFVWYGKEYAEKLGISLESFHSRNTSHLKNLVFPCDRCNTTYTSPLYLENHRKVCKGNRGPKILVEPDSLPSDVRTLGSLRDGKQVYSCPVCQYETGYLQNMKLHLLAHTGQKPHTCDVCGKGFSQTSHLVTHRRIHSGEKQFKCTVCTYSCNRSSDLHMHMKRHTGEKTFACSLCDYKTSVSSNMVVHSRTHTGEKPYSCSQCQYRAVQSGVLTRHIRAVHSGLKPHTCPHCCYSTAWKSDLTQHIKRKHSQ